MTEQPDTRPRERTFSWSDPMAMAAAAAGLSGLSSSPRSREGTIPPPPIMRALDFDGVSSARDGPSSG